MCMVQDSHDMNMFGGLQSSSSVQPALKEQGQGQVGSTPAVFQSFLDVLQRC